MTESPEKLVRNAYNVFMQKKKKKIAKKVKFELN